MSANSITSFGQARCLILDTIMELKSGSMDVGRGMAIAANMKVLNDSVQVEINAAKMAILARKEGHEFGKVVQMGTQLLGHDAV